METIASAKPAPIDEVPESTFGKSLSSDDIRLLSSVGFMAAKAGCLVPAVRIFEALTVLRPGVAFPFIGMSVAYLAVGMAGEAVHVLRDRGIPSCGDRSDLGLWLSFALQQAGDHAASKRELGAATANLSEDDMPSLALSLSGLLGARPGIPDWPTPAAVAEVDADSAPD
jgi:hypothetical protein